MFFSKVEEELKEQIQDFIPASNDFSLEKIWPFIDTAERKFILPVLGRDLYDDMQKFCNNRASWGSGSGEDAEKTTELLRLVRLSEINLAFFNGFDILNAKISDQGFQRVKSQNFDSLYKYQEENVRAYFRETGFNAIDDILSYLETCIEYFPEWENSQAYTLLKTSLIKDTKTFNSICDINNSRLIFLRLQPFMKQVTDLDIKDVCGSVVWTGLMAELKKNSVSDKYKGLIEEISKPLAYLSVALLIQNTGTLTDKGLFFEGRQAGFPDNTTLTSAAGGEKANSYVFYRSTGEKYLESLRSYLRDNFEGYAGVSGCPYSRNNDNKSTFFA